MSWNGTISLEGEEDTGALVFVRREVRVLSDKLKAAGYKVVRANFTHVGSEDLMRGGSVDGEEKG